MSALRELAIFCEGHREIMAHKRFGELLNSALNEQSQLREKNTALEEKCGKTLAALKEKEDALEFIGDIAFDRDGYKSAEKLGELIDEIYGYARNPKKVAELLK